MAEPKTIKTRIINKHATAAVWDTKTTFVPLQAELIIYDTDATHSFERYKIGDGKTPVTQLPFLVNPHTHEFTGVEGKATANYTPTGSVSVTTKPKGTISDVVTNVSPVTKEILVATSEGTDSKYTPGDCTFPELHATTPEDGVLALDVSGGSYTPGKFEEGSKPTLAKVSYVESVIVTIEEPTFTGTQENNSGTFTGTSTTIESTFTPEGTIEESK